MYLMLDPFCSPFFASQLSLYATFLLLILGCTLATRSLGTLGPQAKLFSLKFLGVSGPLLVCLLIGTYLTPLWFLRGLELFSLSGGAGLSQSALKWFSFVFMVGSFIAGFIANQGVWKFSYFFVEFFVALFLLIQVWG
jgi:hypothetical protein